MATLLLPTIKPLSVDDKAWLLTEEDTFTPDGKQEVRTQTIRVLRDGRLIDFPRVMGPSAKYKGADPIIILALGEDSVGHIMDQADVLRADNGLQRALDDHLSEENVIDLMIQRVAQINEYRRRNLRTVARMGKK